MSHDIGKPNEQGGAKGEEGAHTIYSSHGIRIIPSDVSPISQNNVRGCSAQHAQGPFHVSWLTQSLATACVGSTIGAGVLERRFCMLKLLMRPFGRRLVLTVPVAAHVVRDAGNFTTREKSTPIGRIARYSRIARS